MSNDTCKAEHVCESHSREHSKTGLLSIHSIGLPLFLFVDIPHMVTLCGCNKSKVE